MEKGWLPFFDNLRLYLTHFPGQQATPLAVSTELDHPLDEAWSAARDAIGAEAIGQQVKLNDLAGTVERLGSSPGPSELLVRLSEPLPGFLGVYAFGPNDGPATVSIQGWLFSDDAPGYVEREQSGWKAWLELLEAPAT